MKKSKYLLLVGLSLIPSLVFASSGSNEMPIFAAIFMEAFVTIHMSLFFLKPFSNIIAKNPGDSNGIFWKMFWIRVGVLLFFDFFISTAIAFFDFIMVFIGGFLIVPISSAITKKNGYVGSTKILTVSTSSNTVVNNDANVILNCTRCNNVINVNDKFCTTCGAEIVGDNIRVSQTPQLSYVRASQFSPIFNYEENIRVEEFIKRELTKAGVDRTTKLIPADLLRRKKIFNLLFTILLFVSICSIFFHFPLVTYVIELAILVIFNLVTNKYDLVDYIEKEIKSRPSEKISNVIMNTKVNLVEDDRKKVLIIGVIAAVVLPLIMFWNPRIMYEKIGNGYAVRYYTFGITNMVSAEIPEKYNGKDVVSLRGNTFSNMPLLKEVKLPESVTEIRGQAFKNCISLEKVNIPKNLEYLGGGAFYNCGKIKDVVLPDTLTYLGGEAFYNATSLGSIRLSENLSEIRGNTFENCSSLRSIKIPDKVTRIGGHAFYGNRSLNIVEISPNSNLKEIGSSAFRLCDSLSEIYLPNNVSVNERAFKESPTRIYYYGFNDASNGIIGF